ncbi:MAG: hypothetical protein ACXAAT_15290 [Candidatus Hodarchaeales archaeon]
MSDFEDLDFDLEPETEIKSKTPAASKTPASGTTAGPKKNIFFKSTVGPERTEKVSVGERTPVREIRDTIGNIFGLSPDDFHLSHAFPFIACWTYIGRRLSYRRIRYRQWG